MKTISDIMRSGEENPIAQKNNCVRDVLEIMDAKKLGAVCITEDEKLVGIITDGDLRRLILKTQDTLPELFMRNAEMIMTEKPKFVFLDETIDECFHKLVSHRFWVIPVVDRDSRLLGMVHMQDLLRLIKA